MGRTISTRVILVTLLCILGPLAGPGREAQAAPATAAPPAPGARAPGAAAADPGGSWQDRVLERLREAEYEITWQGTTSLRDLPAAWHAPNRAHGFRTYFTSEGIRVVPRSDDADPAGPPSWEWSLTLRGYGRSGRSWAVPEASLSPAGRRMEYGRGALMEWYVNGPRGLEQGFELPAPPEELASWNGEERPVPSAAAPGRGRDLDPEGLIHLDLALGGDLRPVIAADGQAVDFETPSGARVVRYAELRVEDATGRELPAWMEGVVSAGLRGIRIVVDARGAEYPLMVDPLATSPAWTAEIDQTGAFFGISVSTAGDVNGDGFSDVVVGARGYDNGQADEGGAFVYLGSASGLASSPAWSAESNQASSFFGISVSTAGDVNGDGFSDVIVGASLYDNDLTDEGRAFVYHGSPSGLDPNASWIAEGDQASARLGIDVATAGDVDGDGYSDVVVGAYLYDNGQIDEGRALVYHGSASGLSLTADWIAESDQPSALYGYSVSTAGDVDGDGFSDVIVGAYGYDNGQPDEGGAFVYHGSASGLSPTADWTAESEQDFAVFGWSVSTAGDVNGDGFSDVIVGAYLYDNGQSAEGRAFVYHGSASGLSLTADWTAESDQANAQFGYSVSTAGDVDGDGFADVVVGANGYDNGQAEEGTAFVYHGSASGLAQIVDWTAEGDQASAQFGIAVSTAGDVNGDGYSDVIVGAYLYDNGQTNEGRAYVYDGAPSGLETTAGWTVDGDQTGASLGISVSTAGDVNGDGFSDVIVGAFLYDNGQSDEGAAFVYHGSASGLAPTADWMAESDQPFSGFGTHVASAGDVNGDGFSDVIIGAYLYDNGQASEGAAFVYHGSVSGLAPTADWRAEGDQPSANLGWSVSTAGDVNGDGFSDVIVGAPFYDNVQINEGAAFVFHGSASGLGLGAAWIGEIDQASAVFGRSVSTAGDVNGDGFSDVIVGAFAYTNGQTDEGAAFVYHGSASGLGPSAAWSAESDQAAAQFGDCVSTAGDVNGDGFSDVVIGADRYDNGETDEGAAFVYHGSASGLTSTPRWTGESDQISAGFGRSASTAGDVNGDGFADLIVGAYGYDNGQTDEGAAFVYYGSASGLVPGAAWSAEGDQAFALFGYFVSTAGDVNGDGFADVVAGAYYYDLVQSNAGRAVAYLGNGGTGLGARPGQRRADDAAPVVPGLRSRTPGSFRLAALGRTPFGRGRVKLQWEVEPRNHFFDGTGTQRSASWMDTGTAGIAFNELVSSLEPDGYHWRIRLLYDPAGLPLQPAGPWLTVPWGGWHETDIVLGAFIGGEVWEDLDGDGVRDPGEPAMPSVLVYLLDASLTPIEAALTLLDGSYRFELPGTGPYAVRVVVPSGYLPTLPDQGVDDTVDSDVDVLTGETPLIGAPYRLFDAAGWSAGLRLIGPCSPPDEPVFIYGTRLGPGGETILDFQDFNQPQQVSGYNVYRSSDPAPPPGTWPLVATDIVDGDAGTANNQWADTSLDVPPGGIWYYEVAAYNGSCGAEGPF